MRKLLLLLTIAFLLALIPSTQAADNDFGCCANIEFLDAVCEEQAITQIECCPATSPQYGLPQHPADQAECLEDFFTTDACEELPACDLGCCFDPAAVSQCSINTIESLCLVNPNSKFATFTTGTPRGGNLCFAEESDGSITKKFPECPDIGDNTQSCADFSGDEAACTSSICSFCEVTGACLPDCSTCPQTEDSNADGICEGEPTQLRCSDISGENVCLAAGCSFCQSSNECLQTCVSCAGNQRDGDNDNICDNIIQTQFCSEITDESTCSTSPAGCFFCPSPTQGATQCRPQLQSCFQCGENQDVNNDRVCDAGGLPQCSDGIDNDGDGFTDTGPNGDLCCLNPTDLTENNECSCPAGNSCDAYGTQQCFDGGGTPINNRLFDGAEGQICCSTACFIPACQINAPTASFDPSTITTDRSTTYTEPFCACGNTQVNTDSPNADQLFCCQLPGSDPFLQGTPCSIVTFTGQVTNAETGSSIRANVRFVNKQLGLSFEGETNIIDVSGSDPVFRYRIAVAQGITYTLEAEATEGDFARYKERNIVVNNPAGSTINKDISISPISGNCKTEFPPFTITSIDHLQCSSRLTINWDAFDCPITKYVLFRSESSNIGDIIAELGPTTTTFVDNTAEFDTTAAYTLQANLADPEANNGQPFQSNQLSTFVGDAVCGTRCDDTRFCLNNDNDEKVIVGQCDIENKLTEINCQENLAPDAVCIDNGDNNEASCIGTTVCKNLEVAFPNILGMFYQESVCNGFLERNFCYYDVEDADGHDTDQSEDSPLNPLPTIADRCISCTSTMTCFDYKGEDSCETNNCGVGGSSGCVWEQNIGLYSELGRGICFSVDDTSTDDCDECSGLGQCPDNTCLKLGACFANEDASACNACASPSTDEEAPTTCEDYQTEESCQGLSEFTIPGTDLSAPTFIPSGDKCSLGVCRWTGTSCIKDGDDDDIPDCIGTGLLPCRRDTLPPSTQLIHSAFFSFGSENTLAFTVDDVTYGNVEELTLHLCTTTAASCVPDTQVTLQRETDTFTFTSILTPPEDVEGVFTISYFAQDIYKNVETLQTRTAVIDTITPTIRIEPISVARNVEDPTTSDLTTTITSTEFVVCQINAQSITDSIDDITGFPLTGITITPNQPFNLDDEELEELEDGVYRVDVSCTDNALNPATATKSVEVDQNRRITSISPFDELVTTFPVTLEIATLNDQFGKPPYDCTYRIGASNEVPFQVVDQNVEEGTDFTYTSSIPLQDGFHVLDTICRDNGFVVDTATAIFSVDTSPPTVTPLVETLQGFIPLDTSDIYLGNTILSFECEDDTTNFNNLGPLGCLTSDIKFCFGSATQGCFIDRNNNEQNFAPGDIARLPRLTQSGFLCFAASDGVNDNYENPECIFVNVDNDIPQLIDLSINGIPSDFDAVLPFVTKETSIRISGTWIEPSGRVQVRLDNRDAIFVDPSGRGLWTFAPVALQPNSVQSFSITATDLSAVNGRNSISPPLSIQIANDLLGPIIADPQVVNQDEQRIEVLSQATLDQAGAVEFKQPLRLVATISDPKFTNTIIPTSAVVRLENLDRTISTTGCLTNREFPLRKLTGNLYSASIDDCFEVGTYRARFLAQDSLQNPSSKDAFFLVEDTTPPEINITVKDLQVPVTVVHAGGGVRQYTVELSSSEPLRNIDLFNLTFPDVSGTIRALNLPLIQTDSDRQKFSTTLTIPSIGFFSRLDAATGTFVLEANDQNNVPTTQIANGQTIIIDTLGPQTPPTFFTLKREPSFVNSQSFFVSGVDADQRPSVGIILRQALDTTPDAFIAANIFPLTTTRAPTYFKPFLDTDGVNLRGEQILLPLTTNTFTVQDPFNSFDRASSLISPDRYMTFSQPRRFSGRNYEIVGVQVLSQAIKRITISPSFEDDPADQSFPIFILDTPEPPGFFGTQVNLEPGLNAFFAASEDEFGNTGTFSDPHIIFFEDRDPFFFNEIPRDGSVTSDNKSVILVEVQNRSPIVSAFFEVNGEVIEPRRISTPSSVLLVFNIDIQDGLPEGIFDVNVNATDVAGNSGFFDFSFTIDIDVPSTPTVSPIGFINTQNPEFLIEFTTGEIINLTSLTLTGDNIAVDLLPQVISLAPHVFTAPTPTNLPDGEFTLVITAAKIISNEGGIITQSLEGVFPDNTIVIDSTQPQLNISTSTVTSQDTILLQINVSETNLVSTEVTGIDITNTTPFSVELFPDRRSGTLTATIPVGIPIDAEGQKQIAVRSIDQARNSIATTTSVLVDLTPPQTNVIIDAPPLVANKFTNEVTFQVSCSCSDSGSACAPGQKIFFRTNNRDVREITTQPANLATEIGTQNTNLTFRCEVPDTAGNIGVSEVNITVIKEGPQINIIQPEFGGTNSQITRIEIETEQPSSCTLLQFRDGVPIANFVPQNSARTIHSTLYNLGNAFDGTVKTIEYFIRCENDFNQDSLLRNDLLIDTRPLEITSTSLAKGTLVTDTTTNTIQIQTNLDSICRFSTLQQTQPPVIPFSSLEFSAGTTFSRVHNIEHDFGFNGIFEIYIDCIDRTSKTASSGFGFVLQNEINVDFPIQIVDAGILTPNAKLTLREANLITTADTQPILFAKTNKRSFIDGDEACQFTFSALNKQKSLTVQESLESNRLFTIYKLPLSAPLSEGITEVDVQCRSGLDASTATIAFTVDTTPPSAPTLDNLPQRANSVLTVSGTANAETVEILVNDNKVASLQTNGGAYSTSISLEPYANNQQLSITAQAFDTVLNGPSTPSSPRVILVDKISETPFLAIPQIDEADITLTGTAEPSSTVRLYISQPGLLPDLLTTTIARADGTFTQSLVDMPEGHYTFFAKVVDTLQNPESLPSIPRFFTIDTSSPLLIALTPNQDEILTQQNIPIQLILQDASGIDEDSIEIKLDNTPLQIQTASFPTISGARTLSTAIATPQVRGPHTVTISASDTLGHSFSLSRPFDLSFPPACSDGIDNDGDGFIDFGEDFGCCSLDQDSEADFTGPVRACGDGIDNDGDGQTDFCFDKTVCDTACSCATDDDETATTTQCNDGIDNDGDNLIDFPADTGCLSLDTPSEIAFVPPPTLVSASLNNIPLEIRTVINTTSATLNLIFNQQVDLTSITLDNIALSLTNIETQDNRIFSLALPPLSNQILHTLTLQASTTGGTTQKTLIFGVDSAPPSLSTTSIITKDGFSEIQGLSADAFPRTIVLDHPLSNTEVLNGRFTTTTTETNPELVMSDQAGLSTALTLTLPTLENDPPLTVQEIPSSSTLPLTITGTTTPRLPVTITINNQENTLTSDVSGQFTLTAGPSQGVVPNSNNLIEIASGSTTKRFITLVDTAPPTVTLTSPQQGDIVSTSTIEIVFDDLSDLNPGATTIEANGQPLQFTLDQSTNSLSAFIQRTPGQTIVETTLIDITGQSLTNSFSFTQADVPEINILSPLDNEFYLKTKQPFFTASIPEADKVTALLSSSSGDVPLITIIPPTGDVFTFYPEVALIDGETYTIEITAIKNTIQRAVRSKTFKVDLLPPIIQTNNLPSPTNTILLDLVGRFIEDNPSTLTFELTTATGSTISQGSIPLLASSYLLQTPLTGPDQQSTLELIMTDKAGHTTTESITIDKESTIPDVEIIQPDDQSSTSLTSSDVTITVNEDTSAVIEIDNVPTSTSPALNNVETTIPTPLIHEGQTTLTARATDTAQNTGQDTNTITRDITPPTISSISPQLLINSPTPTISFTLADSSRVANTTILVDGALLAFRSFNNPTSVDVNQQISNPLADNQLHTITILANDLLGNTQVAQHTFLVDTSTPTFITSAPSSNDQIAIARPVLTIEYGEPVTLLKSDINGRPTSFLSTNNRIFTHTTNILDSIGEGLNTLNIIAQRIVGSSPDIRTINFVIDTTPPKVTILGIEESDSGLINSEAVTLRVSFSDEHMASLSLQGAREPKNIQLADENGRESSNAFKIPINLTEGVNNLVLTATDQAGNTNISTTTLIRDSVGADILTAFVTPSTPDGQDFRTVSDLVNITGTYSENPITEITIGTKLATLDFVARTFSFENVRITSQRGSVITNNILIEILDEANNRNNRSITILSDKKGPIIEILSPLTNASTQRRPTFSLLTDEPSTQCTFSYIPGQTPITEIMTPSSSTAYSHSPDFQLNLGSNPITIVCRDPLGNTGGQKLISMFIEKLAPDDIPIITDIRPVDGIFLDTNQYLVFKVDQQNIATITLDISATDNSQGVRCRFGDAPTALNEKTLGFDDLNFTLRHFTESFTSAPGTISKFIQCEDRAGKLSAITALQLTIDPDFPVVIRELSPLLPQVNNSDNDFEETLEVTTFSLDTQCKADLIGVGLQKQDMTPVQELGQFIHRISTLETDAGLLEDGTTYTYEISCEDQGQNLQEGTITIEFIADYSIDAPTIDSPINDTVINSTILIAGTAEENAILSILVNGFLSNTTTSNGSYAVEDVPLLLGLNSITVEATDLAGNSNSTTREIFFSSNGPFVQIIQPPPNSLRGELASAQGFIASDVGVDFAASSFEISGPGGRIPATTTTNSATGAINLILSTPLITDGDYTVTLQGLDTRGRSTTISSSFTIDSTLPIITVTSPPSFTNALVDESPIALLGTIASKAELDLTLDINDQTTPLTLTTPGDPNIYSFNFPFLQLVEGLNSVNITATNEFGREAIEQGRITLDSIGPQATITARSITSSLLRDLVSDIILQVTGGSLPVIEDSRPLLRIQFNEPVNPDELTTILRDETSNTIIPLTLFNSTPDNTEFNYQPFQKLRESTYTFTLNATDLIGNNFNEQEFRFAVFFSDLQFVLTEPTYGFSSVNKFNITMVTSRASECFYSNKNVQLSNMKRFNNTGASTHRIRDIFVQTSTNLFVKCIDAETDLVEGASFPLTVDLTSPRISNLLADPNPVVEPPERTTITLTTDDETICKYDEEFAEFDDMRFLFNGVTAVDLAQFEQDFVLNLSTVTSGNLDNLLIQESSFRTDHAVTTPFVDLATKLHTFNIRCRNKAEIISKFNTSLPVTFDLDIPLAITTINTPSVVQSAPVVLNVTTNKGAECFYTNASLPFVGMLRTGLDHTAPLPTTVSGSHTFSVVCAFAGEEASRSLSFIIDSTPPRITRLSDTLPNKSSNNPEVSPFTSKVFVDVQAEDDESAVNEFQIVVREKFSSTVVLNKTRTADQTSNGSFFGEFRGFVSGADLNESVDYRISVRARNTAGLTSTQRDTDGFSVNTLSDTVSCDNDIRDGDETDTDCGGSCRACTTGRRCSIAEDCISDVCTQRVCIAPTCEDDVENAAETDVDCGGNTCDKCATGLDCKSDFDCESGDCSNSAGICVETDACFNRQFDPGTETDLDCGKSCTKKCEVAQKCNAEDDCAGSLSCVQGTCSSTENLDRDEDSVLNTADNCPDTANTDQLDTDNDQEGDACDSDDDNDGMSDDFETRHNLDPKDPSDASQDLDEDGLTNLEEFSEATNPRLPDTDGDGYDDKVEIDKGTDPTNPDSHPGSIFSTIVWMLVILVIIGGGGYAGYYFYKKKKMPSFKPSPPPRPKTPIKKMKPISKPPTRRPSPLRKIPVIGPLAQRMRYQRSNVQKKRVRQRSTLLGGFGKTPSPPVKVPKTPSKREKWITLDAPKKRKLSSVFSSLESISSGKPSTKVASHIKKTLGSDHPTVIQELRKIAKASTLSPKKLSTSLKSIAPHTKKSAHTDIISHSVDSKKISKPKAIKLLEDLVDKKFISKQSAKRTQKKW